MQVRILEAITHQSQPYRAGETVDLPEADARLLVELGHAAPDDKRKTKPQPTDKE